MPPRTIEESHRPRASDRTMHCHSSSGQSYRLVVSENDGRRHTSEMEPQGRTIASPSRTRRQSKTLCLEKTALRVRNYVQTVGLNAETKKDRHRAAGEIFVLTFPLIGLTGFRISQAHLSWLSGCFLLTTRAPSTSRRRLLREHSAGKLLGAPGLGSETLRIAQAVAPI